MFDTAVLLCLGLTGVAQAAGPPTELTVGDQTRPLNVEGTPQFGWMPASSKGNDVQTAYELTVSQGGERPCGTAARSRPPSSPTSRTAARRSHEVRRIAGPLRRGTATLALARRHRQFDTGLTDHDWSGAQWIRRVTTGNDSSDDYTSRASSSRVAQPGHARPRVRVAMGNYAPRQRPLLGLGDNFNHPTEAQYYAFDATYAVKAGEPLALGAMYHYWTCTCQGRANGPISNTTLSAAQAAGATNLKVASVSVFDVGDQITVGTGAAAETTTVTEIGTAGATGTGLTVTPALQTAHASGQAVLDHAGPTGLIVKAVVDHADGTRETFVSDGTWKISKANEYTNGTITTRNGDSGDRAERYDARAEQAGWNTAGFDDSPGSPRTRSVRTRARSTACARPSATSTPRSRTSSTNSSRRPSPSSPTAASSPTSAT